MTVMKRDQMVQAFQDIVGKDGNPLFIESSDFLIGNTKIPGTGHTCTRTFRMTLMEPDSVKGTEKQAIFRIFRISQFNTSSTYSYRFVCFITAVEKTIIEIQQRRREFQGLTFAYSTETVDSFFVTYFFIAPELPFKFLRLQAPHISLVSAVLNRTLRHVALIYNCIFKSVESELLKFWYSHVSAVDWSRVAAVQYPAKYAFDGEIQRAMYLEKVEGLFVALIFLFSSSGGNPRYILRVPLQIQAPPTKDPDVTMKNPESFKPSVKATEQKEMAKATRSENNPWDARMYDSSSFSSSTEATTEEQMKTLAVTKEPQPMGSKVLKTLINTMGI